MVDFCYSIGATFTANILCWYPKSHLFRIKLHWNQWYLFLGMHVYNHTVNIKWLYFLWLIHTHLQSCTELYVVMGKSCLIFQTLNAFLINKLHLQNLKRYEYCHIMMSWVIKMWIKSISASLPNQSTYYHLSILFFSKRFSMNFVKCTNKIRPQF